jgi:sodium-independent sulfate anion transporter 11
VDRKSRLRAIILDFSSVNNVDITSVQRLIDVRNQLDLYTAPDVVDWHVACINNRWTKRALIAGGFGIPTKTQDGLHHRWRSIFSVAEIGGKHSAAAVAEDNANMRELQSGYSRMSNKDEEMGQSSDSEEASSKPGEEKAEAVASQRRKGAIVHGSNRPLFHVDLTSAVQSAIANVEAREEYRASSGQST